MILIAAALMLAGGDQGALRQSFSACLKQANSEAKAQNLVADGFVAFARGKCSGVAEPFQSSLTSANVSHGMSKKAAASDAATQIDDYYTERLENYKIEIQPLMAPKAPPKPQ